MNKKTSSIVAIFLTLFLTIIFLPKIKSVKNNINQNILKVNLQTEPPTLDWSKATDSNSFDVICNIMCGLTQFDDKMNIKPCLASNWQLSDNGHKIIFYLNPKAIWTDNIPLKAGDFVFAFQRLIDPKNACSYAYFLYDIKNARQINQGLISDINKLGVRAVNDLTLEIELEKPCPYFLSLLAFCPTYPMRADLVQKYQDKWCQPPNLVTIGPFKLDLWQHEYKILLSANPKFFEGRPKLDGIKMFMIPEQSLAYWLYIDNQLDYIDNRSLSSCDIVNYRNSPQYHNYQLLRLNYLGFNTQKWPLNNQIIRKAIYLSIDRQKIPKILMRNEIPSCQFLPKQLLGTENNDILDNSNCYNPQLGAKLLKSTKIKVDKLEMIYPNRNDARLVCESIQDDLKRNLGIRVNLIAREWKVYLTTLQNNPPHLFRASWGADYYDPQTFMDIFTSKSGNNYTKWQNTSYDKLVEAASCELNQNTRMALYSQAQNILTKQQYPICPLYFATQNILVKPWVHNISTNCLDLQFFKNVYIK